MTLDRWQTFSKHDQLMIMGSELKRASVWDGKDVNIFQLMLARLIELIDFTISDTKWKNDSWMLWIFRDEAAKFYIGQGTYDIEVLYNAL